MRMDTQAFLRIRHECTRLSRRDQDFLRQNNRLLIVLLRKLCRQIVARERVRQAAVETLFRPERLDA